MKQRFILRSSKTLDYLRVVVKLQKVGLVECTFLIPADVMQRPGGLLASGTLKLPPAR